MKFILGTIFSICVVSFFAISQIPQPGGQPGGISVTSVTGTANQVTVSPTSGAAVFSIPSTFTLPGTFSIGNCTSSAAPAVCAGNSAGSVVVAAAGTTVIVNTTAVTANSQIFVTYDSSLSTKLSVTCNATEPALYGVTARTAATSFTITATSPITNPACFSYLIVN